MASAPLIGSRSLCIQIRSDFDVGISVRLFCNPQLVTKAASVLGKLPRTASALLYCSQRQLVDVPQATTCDNVKQSYACGQACTHVHDKHEVSYLSHSRHAALKSGLMGMPASSAKSSRSSTCRRQKLMRCTIS